MAAATAQRLTLLPLAFEANQGQSDARAKFLARGPGYALFLSPQETVLSLSNGKETQPLRLSFVGANRAPEMQSAELLALKSHYYIGNDPAKWRRNVPNYGRVIYRSIYPGVDLAYYGNQGRLENDLVLAAGADASKIALRVEGARQIATDNAGNVVLTTGTGDVRLLKPHAYQDFEGTRRQVAAKYRVTKDRVSFVLGQYDRNRPLVIDPVIDYMTYVAASGVTVNAVAVDTTGTTTNTYVAGKINAGATWSPATVPPGATYTKTGGGSTDAFILGLSEHGTTATVAIFIGGTGDDEAKAIAVGGDGSVYITGWTGLPAANTGDFPIASTLADGTNGANFAPLKDTTVAGTQNSKELFLSRINPSTGDLLYSTSFGGDGDDQANAIYLWGSYAFLTGSTTSNTTPFPTQNAYSQSRMGNPDAFVAVVNTAVFGGSHITGASCTNGAGGAGGTDSGQINFDVAPPFQPNDYFFVKGVDAASHLTLNSTTNVPFQVKTVHASPYYITYQTSGLCNGNDSTTVSGGTITGAEQYGTYFGGSGAPTVGYAIVGQGTDPLSNFYVAGSTSATSLPHITGAAQATYGTNGDAFVARFDSTQTTAANTVIRSTYLGGSAADSATAMVADSTGVYVAGTTSSGGTATADNAWLCGDPVSRCNTWDKTRNTAPDAFVAKFNPNLNSVIWAAFLGGSGSDAATSIQADASNVYVGGTTGSTDIFSGNGIGSLQGTQDGFVAVLDGSQSTSATQNFLQGFYFGGAGNNDGVAGLALNGTNLFVAGDTNSSDLWSDLPGTTATAYQPNAPGSFTSGGFLSRLGLVYPPTATLNGKETITNGMPGQDPATSHVITYTNSAGVTYSYQLCNGTIDGSGNCANGSGTANNVVFNWPVPRNVGSVATVGNLVGGAGYPASPSTFPVTFPTAPLGGTTAQGYATTSGGVVTSITVTNPGSGYATATPFSITVPPPTDPLIFTVPCSVPPCTQATAQVTALASPVLFTFSTATNPPSSACTDVADVGVTCRPADLASPNSVTVNITATPTTATQISAGTLNVVAHPTLGAANAALPTVTTTDLQVVPAVDLGVSVASISDVHAGAGTPGSVTFTITATTDRAISKVKVDGSLWKGTDLFGTLFPGSFVVDSITPSDTTNWTVSGSPPQGYAEVTSNNGYVWPAGSPLTITIVGHFNLAVGLGSGTVALTAKAQISSSGTEGIDITPGNNGDTCSADTCKTFNLIRDSDLSASTTDNTTPAGTNAKRLSDPLEFTTAVTNGGADDATNVKVTYNLPSTAKILSYSNTVYDSCVRDATHPDYIIVCMLNTLAVANPAATGTLTVTPDGSWPLAAGSATGTMPVTIDVTSVDVNDPGTPNAQTINSNLKRSADLKINSLTDNTANTDNSTRLALSGTLTFTTKIQDAGPDDATSVVVTYTLPSAGFTNPASPDYSVCTRQLAPNDNKVDCTVGNLKTSDGEKTYTLSVTPDPNWVGAAVAIDQRDTTAVINSADVIDPTPAPPDTTATQTRTSYFKRSSALAVTSLTDNTTPAIALGADLQFTTKVRNLVQAGAGDTAPTVKVRYGMGTANYSIGTNDYTACIVDVADVTGNTIVCDVGTLATSDNEKTYHLTVSPTAGNPWPWVDNVHASGTHDFTATIASTLVIDPDPSDDFKTVTSNFERKADLEIAAINGMTECGGSPCNPTSGVSREPLSGRLTYTTALVNNGPDAAKGVRITYTLPTKTFAILDSTAFSNCSPQAMPNDNKLDCTVAADINNGATPTYSLTVRPDTSWIPTGKTADVPVGSAVSAQYAVNPAASPKTTDGVTSYIERRANLTIATPMVTNNDATHPVALSGTVDLTSTVQNLGPDAANGIHVHFTLTRQITTAQLTSSTFPGNCTLLGGVSPNNVIDCDTGAGELGVYDTPPGSGTPVLTYTVRITPDPTWITAGTNTSGISSSGTVVSAAVVDHFPGDDNTTVDTSAYFARKADLQIAVLTDAAADGNPTSPTNPVALSDAAHPLILKANVYNDGPDNATGVKVDFHLTSGSTGYDLAAGQPACSHTPGSTLVSCTLPSTVTAKAAATTFSVLLTPDTNWVDATHKTGQVASNANVYSSDVWDNGAPGGTPDGSADNNNNWVNAALPYNPANPTNAALTSTLGRRADLSMVLSDNTQTTPAALNDATDPAKGTLVYHAHVTNGGTDDAIETRVTFTFNPGTLTGYTLDLDPTRTTFHQPTPGADACVKAGAVVGEQIVCYIGNLAKNTSADYYLSLKPDKQWVGTNVASAIINSKATFSSDMVYDQGAAGIPDTNNTWPNSGTYASNVARTTDLSVNSQTDNTGSTDASRLAQKTATGTPITLTFTTTVQNNGPDDATYALVTYTLPTNAPTAPGAFTWSGYGGGCAIDGADPKKINCKIGDFTKAAGPKTYTLSVPVDTAWVGTGVSRDQRDTNVRVDGLYCSGTPATCTQATVRDPDGTSPTTNNAKTQTSYFKRSSDLQVALTPPSGFFTMKGPITIGTSVTNAGPDDAVGVQIVFTLPMSTATPSGYVVADPNPFSSCQQQTPTANQITCTVGDLIKTSKSVSFQLTPNVNAIAANANPPQSLNQNISADISGTVVDEGFTGNSSSTTFNLRRQADLAISSVNDNGIVSLAGPLTFTTMVQNNGPDNAPYVTVTYGLDQDHTLRADLSPGCTQPETRKIICAIGTVTAGAPMLTNMSVTPASGMLSGGYQATTTTAVSVGPDVAFGTVPGLCCFADGLASNNSSSKQSTVARKANLLIVAGSAGEWDTAPNGSASSANNPVPLSGMVTLHTKIQNSTTNAGDDASGVIVTYTFPPSGLAPGTDVSTNTYPSGCVLGPNATPPVTADKVVCTVDALAASSQATYTLSIRPDPAWVSDTAALGLAAQNIKANISSPNVSDPDTTNNDNNSDSPTFGRVSDLRIHTAVDLGYDGINPSTQMVLGQLVNPVALAGPLTFNTTIENVGDAAKGVKIDHFVPATWLSYSVVGRSGFSSCDPPSSNKVTCYVGADVPNGVYPTTFTLQITPWANALGSNRTQGITTGITVSSPYVYDDNNGSPGGAAGNNNSTNVASTLARRADLRVTTVTDNRSASGSVGAAGPLILTSNVFNGGPDDAGTVGVVYTFPTAKTADYILTGNQPDGSGQTNNYADGCVAGPAATPALASNQVKCTISALGKNSSGLSPYWIAVKPDPGAIDQGQSSALINPTVQISSAGVYDDGTGGVVGSNNTGAVQGGVTLQRLVNLSISPISTFLAGTTTPVTSSMYVNLGDNTGGRITYVFQVNNAAATSGGAMTSGADGVTVTLALPSGPAGSPRFVITGTTGSDTGWSCDAAGLCTLAAPNTIASGGHSTLKVTGYYADDPTIPLLSNGQATGLASVSGTVGSTASVNSEAWPAPVTTATNIQRLVAISAIAASTPQVGTAANLGSDVRYDVTISNGAGVSTAAGIGLTVTVPSNFIGSTVITDPLDPIPNTGWNCQPFTLSCTLANPIPPGTSWKLIFKGQYADSTSVTDLYSATTPGRGQVQVSAQPVMTQSYQATTPAPAGTATDIQRQVHLTLDSHTSTPAAGTSVKLGLNSGQVYSVTYTTTVSNATGMNTAAGVIVKVGVPINFRITSAPAGWDCGLGGVSQWPTSVSNGLTCRATSIAASSSAVLKVYGYYSDLVSGAIATNLVSGLGTVPVSGELRSDASYDSTLPVSLSTNTDIRREVQMSIASFTASPATVSLGPANPVTYQLQVQNAATLTGGGTANPVDVVSITDVMPAYFVPQSWSGSNWNCDTWVGTDTSNPPKCTSGTTCSVTCTLPQLGANTLSNYLTVTGYFDTSLGLGTGQGTGTHTATLSSPNSYQQTPPAVVSATATVQRNVKLGIAPIVAPAVIGADPDLMSYTLTVDNGGPNAVADNVTLTFTLPQKFAVDTASLDPVCNTSNGLTCTYSPQLVNSPKNITVKGKFDKTLVSATGSAIASLTATVSAIGVINSATNTTQTANATVVNTPTGSLVIPLLDINGQPITVTYPTVSAAGITTQTFSNARPANVPFTEPNVAGSDYTTTTPLYFVITSGASDGTAPVAFSGSRSVCVNYSALASLTSALKYPFNNFTKPERIRIFDWNGADVTTSRDQATVCGVTGQTNNPAVFTVREPRNHAPTPKATATQQLAGGAKGGMGTNQFKLDASGTVDPDIHQTCNNGTTVAYCGDTLTYTWSGPNGMTPVLGSVFTQTVPPNADGTLGAPTPQTFAFPLGMSTVTLTVTDQTGASATTQVTVNVSTFTLTTTSQSATVAAGQAASFQVVPQDVNNAQLTFDGLMQLTCTGTKDSDGSSLAANHIVCTVSPSSIMQGQSATALLTTTGPNFSQTRPVRPGSSNGTLALLLGFGGPALIGMVLLPGKGRRWRTWLLLALATIGLAVLLSCGGGSTPPPAQSIPATTPSGTYTVTISGTVAGVSQGNISPPFKLTVK